MIDQILREPMFADFLLFVAVICTMWIVAVIAISFWDKEV